MTFNFGPLYKILTNKLVISIIFGAMIIACAGKDNVKNEKAGAAVDGAQIYKKYCVLCHGADGNLGVNGSKDIRASLLTRDERMELIRHGKNAMTPFSGV
ncbi:MAG TPA: cytochrome c, partial [Saprospiraceae bacterium]|nr:cytochrome c [Saprospiraceae bacterium]